MAKKKPQRITPPRQLNENKARLDMRIDKEVVEKIQKIAEEASISTNQLVQGILRWAVEKAIVGEPTRGDDKLLINKKQAGCIWFGTVRHYLTEDDKECEMHEAIENGTKPNFEPRDGQLIFALDFTERRVVREDI
jgi:hypothetical protein